MNQQGQSYSADPVASTVHLFLSFLPSFLSVTSLSPLAYIPYSFVLLPRKLIKRPSTFSLYFCLSVFLPLSLHSRPLTAYPLCNPWHYARSSTTSVACDVMAEVGAVGRWPQGSFACGLLVGGMRVVKWSCFPLFGEPISLHGCVQIYSPFIERAPKDKVKVSLFSCCPSLTMDP